MSDEEDGSGVYPPMRRLLEERGLAAYVYTQLTDIEEETNGLLTYDRRINKVHEACQEASPGSS